MNEAGVKIEKSCYFCKIISKNSFENALSKAGDALKEEAFGASEVNFPIPFADVYFTQCLNIDNK